jgi:hypothetical protein
VSSHFKPSTPDSKAGLPASLAITLVMLCFITSPLEFLRITLFLRYQALQKQDAVVTFSFNAPFVSKLTFTVPRFYARDRELRPAGRAILKKIIRMFNDYSFSISTALPCKVGKAYFG